MQVRQLSTIVIGKMVRMEGSSHTKRGVWADTIPSTLPHVLLPYQRTPLGVFPPSDWILEALRPPRVQNEVWIKRKLLPDEGSMICPSSHDSTICPLYFVACGLPAFGGSSLLITLPGQQAHKCTIGRSLTIRRNYFRNCNQPSYSNFHCIIS